jgi:hypothetical protein
VSASACPEAKFSIHQKLLPMVDIYHILDTHLIYPNLLCFSYSPLDKFVASPLFVFLSYSLLRQKEERDAGKEEKKGRQSLALKEKIKDKITSKKII